jgi:hypothetical protein
MNMLAELRSRLALFKAWTRFARGRRPVVRMTRQGDEGDYVSFDCQTWKRFKGRWNYYRGKGYR